MSVIDRLAWLTDIIAMDGVPLCAVKVSSVLARRQNAVTGQCNPSAETIAREANLTTRGVSRGARWLEDRRVIKASRHRRRATRYVLLPVDQDTRPVCSEWTALSVLSGLHCLPEPLIEPVIEKKPPYPPEGGCGQSAVAFEKPQADKPEEVAQSVPTADPVEEKTVSREWCDAIPDNAAPTEAVPLDAPEKDPGTPADMPPGDERIPDQRVIDLYHEILPTNPPVLSWSTQRSRKLSRVMRTPGRDTERFWADLFRGMRRLANGHYVGGNGWRADLGWVLKNIDSLIDQVGNNPDRAESAPRRPRKSLIDEYRRKDPAPAPRPSSASPAPRGDLMGRYNKGRSPSPDREKAREVAKRELDKLRAQGILGSKAA
jgi:hypothetical protein